MEEVEKYIFEGKTTNEAIEKGLEKLNLRREDVEINVLKTEEKRSFFSILDPRVVKIEIIKKENKIKKERKPMKLDSIEKAKINITNFLDDFLKQISKELTYKISNDEYFIFVDVFGEHTNALIGYRGESLNALQTILSYVANKGIEDKIRVVLDISGYKEKRKKVLEDLADKISKTVIKTGKKVTLEPMPAYERKIIHSRLQNNKKVTTESVGEEPNRKVIIELIKK